MFLSRASFSSTALDARELESAETALQYRRCDCQTAAVARGENAGASSPSVIQCYTMSLSPMLHAFSFNVLSERQ
jgi:hypothetical protein